MNDLLNYGMRATTVIGLHTKKGVALGGDGGDGGRVAHMCIL